MRRLRERINYFCRGPICRLLFVFSAFLIGVTGAVADNDQITCAARQGAKSIAACSRLITLAGQTGSELTTIYALRGATYRNNGEYDLAIADFTHAIELAEKYVPKDVIAAAYVARASVYSLKGDLELALADYRAAVSLDAKNEQAAEEFKRTESALATPAASSARQDFAPLSPPGKAHTKTVVIPPETGRSASKPRPKSRQAGLPSDSSDTPSISRRPNANMRPTAEDAVARSLKGRSVDWGGDGRATYGKDGSYKYVSYAGKVSVGRYQIVGSQICVTFNTGGSRCDTIWRSGNRINLTNRHGRSFRMQ